MKFSTSLFIFRRDLRLTDNSGLNNALQQSTHVIPCFIFDPRQIEDKNKYKSDNAIQFMLESLIDLDKELQKHTTQLYVLYGKAEDVIEELLSAHKIEAVFFNKDYTPFSRKRDAAIAQACKQHNITCQQSADELLNEPEDVLKKDSTHYSIFTAFYNKAVQLPVHESQKLHKGSWFSGTIKSSISKTEFKKIVPHFNKENASHGGTDNGLKLLAQLPELNNYDHDRNYPSLQTSMLSAHLKFGTVSVRQTYHAIIKHLGSSHPLIRQLYWRDFFTHIIFHAPSVLGNPYQKKYAVLTWNNDKKLFALWCEGKTGFPIIDAGMRQLNTTGFMHNRVRMIVASFLVKDLYIDWQWGEKYFAQKLIDYDPALNNGNWQWCASTGCDAQPYFRIFNPWLQQKKYDPECTYIKKWIPELQRYDNKTIHNWFKNSSPSSAHYPRPIIEHSSKFAQLVKQELKKSSQKQ